MVLRCICNRRFFCNFEFHKKPHITLKVMNKIKSILCIIFLLNSIICIAQKFPGKVIGGADNDQGLSFCLTDDNGYVVIGNTRSQGLGSNDIIIFKMNKNGQVQWQQLYGGIHQDYGTWIEQTSDNGFIATAYSWDHGFARLDALLIKTDANGNEIWSKYFGGYHRDQGLCVKEISEEGYIISGFTKSLRDPGDIFVIRTDEQGNEIWSNNFGTEYVDFGLDVLPTNDSCFLIVGIAGGFYNPVEFYYHNHDADIILLKVNDSGEEIWRKYFGGDSHEMAYSIKKAENGYYIFGVTQSTGAGSFDNYLIKIDDDGNELWSKTYGGEDFEYGRSMDISTDSCLYLFGTTNSLGTTNSPDMYLVKTDKDGNEIWSLIIGGEDSEYGYSVKATPDGGCALLGETKSYGMGGKDIYFLKVDSTGNIEIFSNMEDTIIDKYRISFFPNPMDDFANIEIHPIDNSKDFEINIFDITGRLIRTKLVQNSSKYKMPRKSMAAGTYLYVITSKQRSEKTLTGKFIVR